MKVKRNEFALEFVKRYGDKLSPMHKKVLLKLGKGIVSNELSQEGIRRHHLKMQSLMKQITNK